MWTGPAERDLSAIYFLSSGIKAVLQGNSYDTFFSNADFVFGRKELSSRVLGEISNIVKLLAVDNNRLSTVPMGTTKKRFDWKGSVLLRRKLQQPTNFH